jgi:osmotically-inducible protein OsmY
MRTDQQIQDDVEEELRWDPDVEHGDVAVKVCEGIVTLTGFASSIHDKNQAECAAMRVLGVRGIANDISVRLSAEEQRLDSQIVRDAVAAISTDQPAIADRIQVIVRDGHVTLQGAVESQWQRQRAESAARGVSGVTMVSNLIAIHPAAAADDIKRRIEDAFRRSATVDAQQIQVHAENGEVVLRGAVRSLQEKDEAQRTAWRAPGVHRVVNEITVQY